MRNKPNRLNRTTFLLGDGIMNLLFLPVLTLPKERTENASTFAGLLLFTFLVVGFYYLINFRVRRLHDLGYGGWWSIVVILPFAEILLLILPGQDAKNTYGPQPKKHFEFSALF